MTRILTQHDVAQVLDIDDCITAVENVFRSYGQKQIEAPQSVGVHGRSGTFHIKVAMSNIFATKINANFPGNPKLHGLPTIQGVIVLMDPQQGSLLAILDSTLITTLRTAAASAVAAKHLARTDASVVTIIGCGIQGRAHLEALTHVRPITTAYAWDIDDDRARQFAKELQSRLGIDVIAGASLENSVAASDIVASCTTAHEPILHLRHFHSGLFIAAVGADNPQKSELAPDLLCQCRVVPDLLDQALKMGDLHHAVAAGVMTAEDIHGELAEVICGRVPGRQDGEETFVFDSTGTALQDVAAASIAFDSAVTRNIGLDIALA